MPLRVPPFRSVLRHAALVPLVLAVAGLAACANAQTSPQPAPYATVGRVERADARLDALVPPEARMEVLAEGFTWSEGPVWVDDGGYVLFSDVPRNTIYRWREGQGLGVHLRPAGYNLSDPAGREMGTNGLALDADGRLLVADHGNRAVARIDTAAYTRTLLATHYDGRRLNSPNDLVVHPSGAIYFTDPPYGLAGLNDSPAKELDVNGVYRLDPDGTLTLVVDSLTFPNGVALAPDARTLYVAVSDPARARYLAYDLGADGGVTGGRVLFDATPWVGSERPGLPDGLAVAESGHLFATGPGGVLVLTPAGEHLGTLATGVPTANVAFGGPDRRTLFLTANDRLLRMETAARGLATPGVR